jgi:predicted RNase H-like HicB family nuclease
MNTYKYIYEDLKQTITNGEDIESIRNNSGEWIDGYLPVYNNNIIEITFMARAGQITPEQIIEIKRKFARRMTTRQKNKKGEGRVDMSVGHHLTYGTLRR